MCLQIKNKIGVVLAALLCSAPTMATPITYTFTTGAFGADYRNDFASTPNARALVSPDAYVSGSFIYDPDGPYLHEALATDSTGASFQGAAYQGIYNIEGTLHMSSL